MPILSFKSNNKELAPKRQSWDNQEIADFYRAVEILKQAGLNTEVDSGVTDEGDPWFVFLRPETGDVVAHFAQIDGQFIAVSSLNNEIYKGTDIRRIVDQMLERYPVLIPQNKNQGRLFLHPTAALTAFLAAAFILTIDGVKANNLGDVLSAASSNVSSYDEGNRGLETLQRFDSIKTMFSDLTLSNYNIAVLGAALIAHELYLEDTTKRDHFLIEDNQPTQEGNTEPGGNDTKNLPLIGDHKFTDAYAAQPLENTGEDVAIISTAGDKDAEEARNTSEKNGDYTGSDLSLFRQLDDDGSITNQHYGRLWSGKQVDQNNEYQNNKQPNFNAPIIEISTEEQYQSGIKRVSESESISQNLSDFKGVLLSANFEPGRGVSFFGDEVEIAFGDTNDVTLAAMEALSFNNTLTSIPTSSIATLGEAAARANKTFEKQEIEPAIVLDQGASDPVNHSEVPLPIMGHSFINPNQILQMTSALDVVFYRGGDAEIAGFELGKDLLWFFLSQEELDQAKNSVNEKGDLSLDFGEIGTLTFLGVVPEVTDVFIA